jgi:hypothetical protein
VPWGYSVHRRGKVNRRTRDEVHESARFRSTKIHLTIRLLFAHNTRGCKVP